MALAKNVESGYECQKIIAECLGECLFGKEFTWHLAFLQSANPRACLIN
jgi:hypothetical protein